MDDKYFYKVNKIRTEGQPLIEKIEKADIPPERQLEDYSYISADGRTYTKNPKFSVHETEESAFLELRTYFANSWEKSVEKRRKLAREMEKIWNKMERLDELVESVAKSRKEMYEMVGGEEPYHHDWVKVPERPTIPEPEKENRGHPLFADFIRRKRRIGEVSSKWKRIRR